jgi:hypothetical protein
MLSLSEIQIVQPRHCSHLMMIRAGIFAFGVLTSPRICPQYLPVQRRAGRYQRVGAYRGCRSMVSEMI